MTWLPTPRIDDVTAACLAALRFVVCTVVPSMANTTGPVGVPAPGAGTLTVAVNVTGFPKLAEPGGAATRATVVGARLTTWFSPGEVLPRKLASPPYTAVIGWFATENAAVVNANEPPTRVPVPSGVAPSNSVTEPVGDPEPAGAGVTVAVSVTG